MSNTVAEESDTRLSPNAQGNDRVRVAADAGKVKTAAPFALIVDDNEAIGRFVAKALAGIGVDSATYQSAKLAIDSLDQQRPDIIFLDIALIEGDAIDMIKGLSEKHHTAVVQLMSGGRPQLLEAVQRVGARYGLTLLPPLLKPFRVEAISDVIVSAGLARNVPPLSGSRPPSGSSKQ